MERGTSINELLQVKEFSGRIKIVTNGKNQDKPITHVTIMEGPDLYEWVTGGELVLTTWYSFSKQPEIAVENFRKLAVKISAIGIKTKRFIDEIPSEIIDVANESGVTVFEVDKPVKFREFVRVITGQIQNYQMNLLVESEKFYQRLVEVSIYENSIKDILYELKLKTGYSLKCLDADFNEVESIGYFSKSFNIEKIKKSVEKSLLEDGVFFNENIDEFGVLGCYGNKKITGYLVTAKNCLEDDRLKLACQQASLFVGLRLFYENEPNQTVIKRLFKKILEGKIVESSTAEKIIYRASKLHLDSEFVMLQIYIEEHEEELYRRISVFFNRKLLVQNHNEIYMLCTKKDFESNKERMKDLISKSKNCLCTITPSFSGFRKLALYYRLLLDVGKFLHGTNVYGFRKLEDWLVYSSVLSTKNTPTYTYLKQEVLMKIVDHDNKYNTRLLETIAVVSGIGNLKEAAHKLFIHINTLRYRLGKIKELTNLDFFESRGRFELTSMVFIAFSEGMFKGKVMVIEDDLY